MTRGSARGVRRRPLASSGSLLVVGLLLASLTVVVAAAAELNRPLLRVLDWLSPARVLVLVAVAVALAAVPMIRERTRHAGQALAALPPAWSLAGLVVLGASLQIVRGARKHAPFVLSDELVYSDLAKSFARDGELLLRGSLHLSHSVLYPVAISPFFALASDSASALAALGVAQALWMALAAVPAYCLASRVVSRGLSLAVAALTAFSPWLGYAALVMTEALFFPCFLVFALVLARMLERPTALRQSATLGLVLALVLIRPQAFALVPAIATAVLIHARRVFGPYAPLLAASLTLTAVACLVLLGRVGGPGSAYSVLFDDIPSFGNLTIWSARNLAGLGLALGIVPLLLLPAALVRLLGAGASAPERALGATTLACLLWLTASVALVSSSPLGFGWVHERGLFFVAPLVLACVAHWLSHGASASRRTLAISAIAMLATLASLTEGVVTRSSDFNAPALASAKRLLAAFPSVPSEAWSLGAAAAACAVLLLARGTVAPLLAAGGGALLAAGVLVFADDLTLGQASRVGWVDTALPPGATATLLHVDLPVDPTAACAEAAEYEQQGLAVWTEFFNNRIDRVVHFGGPIGRDAFDSPEVHLARARGILLTEDGQGLGPDFVVVDSRETIAGVRLKRFEPNSAGIAFGNNGSSMTLWRAEKPLRVGPRQPRVPPRADGKPCQASSTTNRSSKSS